MNRTETKAQSILKVIAFSFALGIGSIVLVAAFAQGHADSEQERARRERQQFWEVIQRDFDGVGSLRTAIVGFGWRDGWRDGYPEIYEFEILPDRAYRDHTVWVGLVAIDPMNHVGREVEVTLVAVFDDPDTGLTYLREEIGSERLSLVMDANAIAIDARIPRHQLKKVTGIEAEIEFVPKRGYRY